MERYANNRLPGSMNVNRAIKIVAIVCLGLVATAIVVARNSPATGYESSIYSATPPIVWVALVVNFVCGTGIVIHQLYTKGHQRQNIWVIGLFLILVGFVTLWSLYIIRGYVILGGDVPTHLGIIRDISSSGHFAEGNYYPLMHVYVVQLSQICGIDSIILSKSLPIVFALLYVAFMYLLARYTLPARSQWILVAIAAAAGITFLHHYGGSLMPVPNHLANLFLPLAVYLLMRNLAGNGLGHRRQFSILLIITIFLFPLFHPVTSIALLFMMATLLVMAKIVDSFAARADPRVAMSARGFSIPLMLLLFVWAFTWISSRYFWGPVIQESYSAVAVAEESTHLSSLVADMQYAQSYGYSVVEQFFSVYGGSFVYLFLTLISIPLVLEYFRKDRQYSRLIYLYGPIAVFILVSGALYMSKFIIDPVRSFTYAVMLSAVFVGFVLSYLIQKARSSHGSRFLPKLYISLVVLILVTAFTGGILRFYPSPYTMLPSAQVTQSEIDGMRWFFFKRDTMLPISTIYSSPRRFADLFLTPEERRSAPHLAYDTESTRPPWHFGYNKSPSLGESYDADTYMVLTSRDRLIYEEVYERMAAIRFNSDDFETLEHDPLVDKLYTNGEMDVWYIHGSLR